MTYDSTALRLIFRALVCAVVISAWDARAEDSPVYKVAKFSVDVRAKDAVTAKNTALRQAKQQALLTVMRRIAPFNSFDQLPAVKPEVIDDMLEGFSVRKERNSATRYLATLDFRFSRDEVRKLLEEKNMPISDQQSERITVLPVFVKAGQIDQTGRDPWRTAWNELDLDHAVVPVRLARTGPSFTMESLSQVLDGDVQAFVALRDKLKADKLVLGIAETTADGGTLTTQLFGVDHVGSIALTRHDPVYRKDVAATAQQAAHVSHGVLEGRWKLVQSPGIGADGAGALTGMEMVAEFSGMGQWKDMRARLLKVPGVQGLDVKSLSARTAQIAFQYPGGGQRLAGALRSQGLSLEGGEGNWILRSN